MGYFSQSFKYVNVVVIIISFLVDITLIEYRDQGALIWDPRMGLRDPGTPNKLCGRIRVWGCYVHVPGKTVHNFHQILQGVCEQREFENGCAR